MGGDFEATLRALFAIAVFLNRHFDDLRDKLLCQTTDFRMNAYRRRQRTAITSNHNLVIMLFDLRGAAALLQLGAAESGTDLPPVFGYWREFASRYMSAMCGQPAPESRAHVPVPPPPEGELEMFAAAAPPMTGAEYLTGPVLQELWQALDAAFAVELAESKATLQEFLRRRCPAWNLVGRVHFYLAEIRQDAVAPFAFLASYTSRLSAQA